MLELRPIIEDVLDNLVTEGNGIHGLLHWGRVYDNGIKIAEKTNANVTVVQLFAFYHDSRRFNDGTDVEHGLRGAEFAKLKRGDLFDVTDEEFDMLYVACRDHAEGYTQADVTVQACWDADRLDLYRASIKPKPDRLCTAYAKKPNVRGWANARAESGDIADIVRSVWNERFGR